MTNQPPEQRVPEGARVITKPLVIMYETENHSVNCELWPSQQVNSCEAYGLIVCDLVRHIARKFGVEEDAVWRWVDLERNHHTTEIRRRS
ncbi:MAG: hypothetical protein ACJ8R9_05520 [Steroidobacteraceae bacterium]